MAHSRIPDHSRRWLILAMVALAQLMVVLDLTIVNIALPSAQRALHFSNSDRQWVVTAYALGLGALLPLGRSLSDLFGRRRMLVIGLVGFAGISAVGGMAPSCQWLLIARSFQGLFAALLSPAALSALNTAFTEPAERGKAFGVYGAVAGSGAAVGLLLGGVLTEYLSWRWCLYVDLMLAAPAVLLALTLLSHQPIRRPIRLDLPGALTGSLGVFSLVYAFSHAESAGWDAATTLACLAAGVVLLAVFVAIQHHSARPMLPLRLLADRNRAGSYLAVLIVGIGMFGVFLFVTYYLQQTLSYSPATSGLAFLPMVGMIVVSSTTANTPLLARSGPRPLIASGMELAAVGTVLLTRLGLRADYGTEILPALLLVGTGVGLVMAAAINTANGGVDVADSGIASALVTTGQQIGGSIGTAVLSTLAASATATYLATHHTGTALAAHATLHGYTVAFATSAGVFAAGAVICGLILRRAAFQHAPNSRPGDRRPTQPQSLEASS
jgi:EmrB/QacA subfamily drug resistance transporter